METKKCSKCGKDKGLTEFYIRDKKKNIYRSNCKECFNKWQKKNRDKVLKYKRKYNNSNRQTINEKNREFKKENRPKVSKAQREYRSRNKDKVRQHDRRRRDRKRVVCEVYTVEMENITKKEFENKCFNCGSKDKLCVDHHRPLSAGYPLTLDNAVILCRSCNSSKWNKDPMKFYGQRVCKELDEKLKKIAKKFKER